jgi:hypothetical protein
VPPKARLPPLPAGAGQALDGIGDRGAHPGFGSALCAMSARTCQIIGPSLLTQAGSARLLASARWRPGMPTAPIEGTIPATRSRRENASEVN